jgi:hypothetical protein
MRSTIAGLALALCGCATEYTYTPPTTAEGRACAGHCQDTQMSCRVAQDRRRDGEMEQCKSESAQKQSQCEHDSQIEYDACLRYAKTDADRKGCHKQSCDQPGCFASSSYDLCDSDYRACYQNCGGTVGVLK